MYFADHFMPNTEDGSTADGVTLECWTVLSGLAGAVPRLRLGPLVCGNTYRHPAVLAKMAATIDHVSGGRFVLGLGAGWQVNEHRAYGIELPPVKQRLDRFEEACAVITGLLREPRVTFKGEYYEITDAPCDPKPVQARLPLLIGGGGEKRTLRIAARYADEWNTWSTPEVLAHKRSVLHQHCAAIGRDPSEIVISTQALVFLSEDESWLATRRDADVGRAGVVGTPSEVVDIMAAYREAGADEFIVPTFTLGSAARRQETVDLFNEQVAVHFR
jgi:F420-dependent oxidoreductase-like protein